MEQLVAVEVLLESEMMCQLVMKKLRNVILELVVEPQPAMEPEPEPAMAEDVELDTEPE